MWGRPVVKARHELTVVAAVSFLLCGAIVVIGGMWLVTRLADPVARHRPAPLELAHLIRVADLGCDDWHRVDDPDDLTFAKAIDEVDCGSGAGAIVIARFENRNRADAAMRALLCRAAPADNHTYVLGPHWVIHSASDPATRAIATELGGTLRRACA
jgi:hypothetical protein